MRTRSVSAIGVVILALVPALAGGLVFTIAFTSIALLAFREALPLFHITRREPCVTGAVCITVAGLLAWLFPDGRFFPLVVAICVLTPFVFSIFQPWEENDRHEWSKSVGATLYLAVPTFAAIALRGMEGTVDRSWFRSVADAMPGPNTTEAGLGWFLTALLITWLSDTAAYLVGKSVGRNRLIPRVSPNKTVEGAIGGLVAAGIAAALCTEGFGLDIHPLTAAIFGIGVGIVGMLGDLSESMLKRRAGVKDSGTLIPGHGGMLDRIDSLVFVVTITWALLPALV